MPNYDVNYDDTRFKKVESDKSKALTDVEKTYSGMIEQSDGYYQKQIDAVDRWEEEQKRLQNEKTDFAIEKIEQQKAQAKKDYTKEQSGAYVDWQKQSNQYGANAEAMAAQGMANTGYAESSQVSMYNTYQNRVATAREAYNLAVMNYNNSIKEAQLQNNSILAELAYESLQKQLELSLQGFQYKNQLVLDLADKKRQINDTYYNRYQDVLKQINTENALAEEVRQYNASLAEQQRQYNETMAFQKEQFAWQKAQAAAKSASITKSSGSSSKGGSSSGKSSSSSSISKDKNTSSSSVNKSSGSAKKNQPTIDMQSVLALGYGPISEKRLSELVDNGLVSMYVVGDKVKFKHSAAYVKQKGLMG